MTDSKQAPKRQPAKPATRQPAAKPAAKPVAKPAPAAKAAAPATVAATARARSPRKAPAVAETVARHQKELAAALEKAEAISYEPTPAAKAKPAKASKPSKVKKAKLVRDSYAMPEAEYAQIAVLKKRLGALGSEIKKSELLRAGIAALAALNDTELKAVTDRVERIKTGRPSKK